MGAAVRVNQMTQAAVARGRIASACDAVRPMLLALSRLTFGVVAIALLAAPPALSQTADEWQGVIAAAKKEGKLVVYSAAAPPMPGIYASLFEKRYGIPVETLEARPSELRERI